MAVEAREKTILLNDQKAQKKWRSDIYCDIQIRAEPC